MRRVLVEAKYVHHSSTGSRREPTWFINGSQIGCGELVVTCGDLFENI
jgi:hypothetical protein